MAKDEFYRKLFLPLQSVRPTNVMVVAGDFDAQLDHLAESEYHIKERFSVLAGCNNNNGDQFMQVHSDRRLFTAQAFVITRRSFAFTALVSN